MITLAIRNILRQKARTAMTLAAIVSGVVGLILGGGWVNDIFVQLGEALIHSQSGHLQISRLGFFESGSRTPEQYLIADQAGLKQRIAATPGVSDAMARLKFSGLLNNGHSDLPIVGEGVEPDKEAALGTFMSVTAGRQLSDSDTYGIAIGRGVAKGLGLKPGDRVTLLANTFDGALNTLDLQVVGIFQSFSDEYDARAARITLTAAHELLGTQGANTLVITLNKTEDTLRVARTLQAPLATAGLEVRTWTELNDFYEKTVMLYKRQFGVLQFIILVMVLLSVANSVNMSVFERVGEFGTMRSLGNRSSDVLRLVVTESALLGVLGSLLGVVLGVLLALGISAIGIPMPPPPNASLPYIAHIQIEPVLLSTSAAIGLLATVAASIPAGLRVSQMPVVEALRQNI